MARGFEDPEQLMHAWAQAVSDNDLHLLGEVFADDADFVNLFGSIWQGQTAIVDGHAWALDGVLKDSTMELRSIDTRFISDEAVVMRGVCHRGRLAEASAGTLASGTTSLLMVAQHDAEGWKVISGANIAQQPPAA